MLTKSNIKGSWFDQAMQASNEFPTVQWYVKENGAIPNTLVINEKIETDFLKFTAKSGFVDLNSVHKLEASKGVVAQRSILIKGDIMLLIFYNSKGYIDGLKIYYQEKESIEFLVKEIKKELDKQKQSNVWLVRDNGFYDLTRIDIPKTLKSDQLELHYGEEFKNVHDNIRFYLMDFKSRFILLHGKPGTGKTNYLRYIVNSSGKRFIYIPNTFLEDMSGPKLTDFLLAYKAAVFIVEDAERLLMSRKNNPDSPVNTFLNLTDGFLSDAFKFKFIVTINGDVKQLDEALLRKGRLALAHEFKPLNELQSNKLAKHLKITNQLKGENTLSEIYNLFDPSFDFKGKMGF